jgi:hypothetical protein
MKPDILPFRDLLSNRLAKAQNAQFHHDMITVLSPLVNNIDSLSIVWPAYVGEAERFGSLFRHSRKMYDTSFIEKKDSSRDFFARGIMARITSLHSYPMSDEEKEDAGKLFFIANDFRGAARKEYQSEIYYIKSFVARLRNYPELLGKYGLTSIVDKLENENVAFEELYNERSMEYIEQPGEADIRAMRRAANHAFSNVCKVIEGMMLTPVDADLYKQFENMIAIMNVYIDEYTVKYHRHAGVVKAQKKKKEEAKDKDNGEAGKEKPKDDRGEEPGKKD